MKKAIFIVILLLIWAGVYAHREEVSKFIVEQIDSFTEVEVVHQNNYALNTSYNFVKPIKNNNIENKEELFYLIYSVINSGYDDFQFYCPKSYKDCIVDATEMLGDNRFLSYINTFVHPFNSFDSIKTTTYQSGKVELIIEKNYSKQEIEIINNKVDKVIKEVVKDEKDPKKVIKLVHDYIINNTKYDSERANNKVISYKSDIAYGVLMEGYGICGGYSDSMAIFLNRYNIPNFKVESEDHVWNAVYLNDKWLHLDLTWDDPVISDGSNVLIYDYFLIDSEALENKKDGQHNFDKNIYKEVLN